LRTGISGSALGGWCGGFAGKGGGVRERRRSGSGLQTGGGHNGGGATARVAASTASAGGRRAADQAAVASGTGGFVIRLGKSGTIESGNEPLPLGYTDPDARATWFDEPGQAVAVCLYELVRGRKKTSAKILAGKKEKTRPTSGDLERLTQALLEVLRASGYVKPRTI